MLSHDKIWAAIDRLAESHQLTTSGLARRAGLDPTSFNKSKRTGPDGRMRWPSTESISKVLEATGTGIDQFMGLIQPETGGTAPNGGFPPQAGSIPLLGFAQAGAGASSMTAAFPRARDGTWSNFPPRRPARPASMHWRSRATA
jgi:phage repressor protein C with HTH and peptisase S24 domain